MVTSGRPGTCSDPAVPVTGPTPRASSWCGSSSASDLVRLGDVRTPSPRRGPRRPRHRDSASSKLVVRVVAVASSSLGWVTSEPPCRPADPDVPVTGPPPRGDPKACSWDGSSSCTLSSDWVTSERSCCCSRPRRPRHRDAAPDDSRAIGSAGLRSSRSPPLPADPAVRLGFGRESSTPAEPRRTRDSGNNLDILGVPQARPQVWVVHPQEHPVVHTFIHRWWRTS